MAKRKSGSDEKSPEDPKDIDTEDESGSDDNDSLLDVEFEWFDPQAEHDFHGLKTLLRQLFDVDNQLFNLSELTDLILAQPLLGSTVKVEGNESDPYAFLTVLNLHQHRGKKVIQDLTNYLLSKASDQQGFDQLEKLLSPDSPGRVGVILTERFINMPAQIVPPMYNMLLEEIQWALEEKELYQFSHYIVISKTYTEVASKLDEEDDRPQKKKNKNKQPTKRSNDEIFYFHPEDEVLHMHAQAHCNFDYTNQPDEGSSDSKRAFQELGVRPRGHLIIIESKKFENAVKAVREYLSAGQ